MKKILFVCFVAVLCLVACDRDPKFVQIIDPPTTAEATNITRTSAEISAVYSTSDSYERKQIDNYGFYLSTTSTFDSPQRIDVSTTHDEYADGKKYIAFNATLTELEQNTEYFYYAFVSKRNDIIKGEVKSFTTNNTAVVTTQAATNITINSVQVNGTITKISGQVNLQKRGFLLSISSTPTIYSYTRKWEEDATNLGTYSHSFYDLTRNHKYYIRAYAVIDNEIVYGNIMEFTTEEGDFSISMVLNDPTNVTSTSATVSGTITLGANATITEVGIKYVPATEVSFDKLVYYSGSQVSGWTGTHIISGTITFDELYSSYYYYMYYISDGQTYTTTSKIASIYSKEVSSDDPRNDILGTYSMSAIMGSYVNYDTPQNVTWSGIRIVPYGGENEVKVIGLYRGSSDYVAYGTYNKSTKKLTLRKTTDEELPTFSYYDSYDYRYYTVGAYFQPIEWAYCGDCGVWSGSTIPISSAESGDFVLTSAGRLEQGKSKVSSSNTWYFTFDYYSSEKEGYILGYSTYTHDVVLTRTSTTY